MSLAKDRHAPSPHAPFANGAEERIAFVEHDAPFGRLLVAATARGVCRVMIDAAPGALAADRPRATLVRGDGTLRDWAKRIAASLQDPAAAAAIPRDVRRTPFQERVWAALSAIPPGETRSYAEIATSLGQAGATRAVGSACGANRLAVLIPCHRALRSDGSLGGFAWGLPVKRRLLDSEQAARSGRHAEGQRKL